MEDSFDQIRNIASKYDSDDIFVVGKGPSVDEAEPEVFSNGLVINLNDSERIVPGDICVFHAPWVLDSLSQCGFSDSLYVTQLDLPAEVAVLNADYVPVDQESAQLMFHRFNDTQLFVEGVLLVSALRIAKVVADYRMRRQRVYFVGFDFNMGRGYSKNIAVDYSGDETNYQSTVVSAQEHYFIMFSYLLRESNLLIKHVGTKSYSKLSYSELNAKFGDSDRVAVRSGDPGEVSGTRSRARSEAVPGAPGNLLITAEITTNHFGDLRRLEMMIRKAKKDGADLVKLQKRDVETFYTRDQLDSPYSSPFGETFGEYRHAIELDDEGFEFVDRICNEVGIDWFVSVLDLPSFRFMQKYERQFVKLPSTISQHRDFIETVAKEYRENIVISTGFTDQAYEDFIVDTFQESAALYLLQCTSAYPTPPDDCNVAVVRHYSHLARQYQNIRPGYSSHDVGSTGCMLAVAAGARMVEKHVKFGDTDWAHFDIVALDLNGNDFAEFVTDVRLAERITGSEVKKPIDTEHHKYWVGTA